MGLRIFLHSVRLVFNQFGGALRISGLLYLIATIINIAATLAYPPTITAGQADTPSWQMIVASIIAGALCLWIAVAWHRFVLIDEVPDTWLPTLRGGRILAYLGRMLQVGLISGGLVFVWTMITVGFAALGAQFLAFVGAIGGIVLFVFVILLGYRVAPMFPGAAVAQPIGFRAAWTATSGATGSFFVLAILSVIASILIDLPAVAFAFLPAINHILAPLWLSVTGWVKLLVGVSILTTIYGVYVEKRPIAE